LGRHVAQLARGDGHAQSHEHGARGRRGPGVDGRSLGHAPGEFLEAEPLRLLARVGREAAHPLGQERRDVPRLAAGDALGQRRERRLDRALGLLGRESADLLDDALK
jgi:hypothetical protein